MLPSLAGLVSALLAASSVHGSPLASRDNNGHHLEPRFINLTIASVCQSLNSQTSVYGILSLQYTQDTAHYMSSSYQPPTCLVKPKSAAELSSIMKIIGSRRIQFAVSAGGHASNQGFSSTKGVHITLNGLTLDGTNSIKLSADQTELTYTPGRVWDSLYEFMAQNAPGRQVVGGRVSGVGVGGFVISGGGYSWLSNQYGLTIDTLLEVQIVLPNGDIVTASPATNPDLFFGIRGGGNQFGIVTSLRVKTFPTGSGTDNVYGGIKIFGPLAVDELAQATANFSRNNQDPKANVLPTFNAIAGVPGAVLLQFYDGETAPPGTFAAFDSMKAKPLITNVKTQPWLDFVKSAPADATAGTRGAFHTISIRDYSPKFMKAVADQMRYYGSISLLHSGTFISYDVEPFVSSYFDYSQGGAYPHVSNNGKPFLPLNLYFTWLNPLEDSFWRNEMKKSAAYLLKVAADEGQSVYPQIRYPNYSLQDTPLVELFGDNLPALQALKSKVDPNRIMDLTGGFRIPSA